jgi:hypothetical protein
MARRGLKAVGMLLTRGRQSRRHANWTLTVAIFSTLVTVALIALYLMQGTPEFP